MNVKQLIALSAIALASSAAMADGGDIGAPNYPAPATSTVTRASVKAGVIAARADGELRVAGDAGDVPYAFEVPTTSTLSRADVKLATLQAAKAGQLAPAGVGLIDRPDGEYSHAVVPRNVFASIANKLRSSN
jgi:hypothetical protein